MHGWTLAKWGLIRSTNREFYPESNQRKDRNCAEKNLFFKTPFEQRRCLVPADGYFEWQKLETQKYPHFPLPAQRDPIPLPWRVFGMKQSREGNQTSII